MTASPKRDESSTSGWTVDAGVLMFEDEPRMELHSVTRAHCSFSSRFRSYGIFLGSETAETTVGFGGNAKAFSRTGSKILSALHRSAPEVRVHMRGGKGEAAIGFMFGLVCLGGGLFLLLQALNSSTSLQTGRRRVPRSVET